MTVRTRLALGFNLKPTARLPISDILGKRLATVKQIQSIEPIVVRMQARTAILSGTVASASQRQLAYQLALLQPGIVDVQNDLQIAEVVNSE